MEWVELVEWLLDQLLKVKNKNIKIKHINNRTNSEITMSINKI